MLHRVPKSLNLPPVCGSQFKLLKAKMGETVEFWAMQRRQIQICQLISYDSGWPCILQFSREMTDNSKHTCSSRLTTQSSHHTSGQG